MAFEEVAEAPAEIGAYWNPEKEGEAVEGNIYDFVEDRYGHKRISLYLGSDEYGEPITTLLPSHTHLRRFYKNLEEGDYIRVELVEKIPPTGSNQYPTMKYRVLKDPERGVDWE